MRQIVLVSIERIMETKLMLKYDGWIIQIELEPATIENNQIKISGSMVYYKNGEIKSEKEYTEAFVEKYLQFYGEK